MSEFRVYYQEPGLGGCLSLEPYPGGTVYRTPEAGRTAAPECPRNYHREGELWECGASGMRPVPWENER